MTPGILLSSSTPPTAPLRGSIHYSPSQLILEDALFSEVESLKRDDPLSPVVVVTGSGLVSDYLTYAAARRWGGIVNLHIRTFGGLAKELSTISSPVTLATKPSLPVGLKPLLIHRAVQQAPGGRPDSPLVSVRFLSSLASVFDDLDQAALSDDSGIASLQLHSGSSSRWEQLLPIWREYRRRIAEFTTDADFYRSSRRAGEAYRRIYGTDRILIYGIYDLNGLQEMWLDSLLDGVYGTFFMPAGGCFDEYGSAFEFADRRLLRWTARFHLEAKLLSDREPVSSLPIRLFRYAPADRSDVELAALPDVKLAGFATPDDEVDRIVAEVLRLMLDESVPPERIAIILWNSSNYLERFRDRFNLAGVPLCNQFGRSLIETNESGQFLQLLQIDRMRCRNQQLTDYFGLLERTGDENPLRYMHWERIIGAAGLYEASLERWIAVVKGIYERLNSAGEYPLKIEVDAGIALDLTVFLQRIDNGLKQLDDAATLAEQIVVLCDFLRLHLVEGNESVSIESELRLLAADSTEPAASRDLLLEIVRRSLAETHHEPAGRYLEGVTLATPDDVRGLGFDHLFLPGMAAGRVPSGIPEGDLLSDSERRRINLHLSNDPGFPVSIRSERTSEQRLLLGLIVSSARRTIHLSYSRETPFDGSGLLPSRYIIELARLLNGAPVDSETLSGLPYFHHYESGALECEPRLLAFDRALFVREWCRLNCPPEFDPARLRFGILHRLDPEVEYSQRVYGARRRGDLFTAWDGVIGEVVPSRDALSVPVTGIETWAQCPYRYLLTVRLGLAQPDEVEPGIAPSAAAVGSLIHKALARLFNTARNDPEFSPLLTSNRDRNVVLMNEKLKGLLDAEIVDQVLPAGLHRIYRERLRRRILRAASGLAVEDASGWVSKVEHDLREELNLKVDDIDLRLELEARIDRIDEDSSGRVRIVDYKTGGKVPSNRDYGAGTRVQIPLYILLQMNRRPHLSVKSFTGEYLWIDSAGRLKSVDYSGTRIFQDRDELESILSAFLLSETTGFYPPLKHSNADCAHCPASNFCDMRSRSSAKRRGASDPRATRIEALRAKDKV
ncbi:MAG: hypothetical protein FJY67_05650 [Calditrichaeota bacterium]|nr:hypothetical protein [Calditrichota bacterium]